MKVRTGVSNAVNTSFFVSFELSYFLLIQLKEINPTPSSQNMAAYPPGKLGMMEITRITTPVNARIRL